MTSAQRHALDLAFAFAREAIHEDKRFHDEVLQRLAAVCQEAHEADDPHCSCNDCQQALIDRDTLTKGTDS